MCHMVGIRGGKLAQQIVEAAQLVDERMPHACAVAAEDVIAYLGIVEVYHLAVACREQAPYKVDTVVGQAPALIATDGVV